MKLLHCLWHINERSMGKYGGYSVAVTDVVSILSVIFTECSEQAKQTGKRIFQTKPSGQDT